MKAKRTKATGQTQRGRPPKITRDDIISASLRSKKELSLKSVADELRVTTQALYHYVSGLGDIMEMVTEKLAGRYPFPGDDGRDWFNWAYEVAHVLRRVYEEVPGLAEYAINTPWQMTHILARYELSLTIARRTGLDDMTAYWGTRGFIDFVYTWVAREQRRAAMLADRGKTDLAMLIERVDKLDTKFPLLASALHNAEKASSDERFDLNLRLLLTGIAQKAKVSILLPASFEVSASITKLDKETAPKAGKPAKKKRK